MKGLGTFLASLNSMEAVELFSLSNLAEDGGNSEIDEAARAESGLGDSLLGMRVLVDRVPKVLGTVDSLAPSERRRFMRAGKLPARLRCKQANTGTWPPPRSENDVDVGRGDTCIEGEA